VAHEPRFVRQSSARKTKWLVRKRSGGKLDAGESSTCTRPLRLIGDVQPGCHAVGVRNVLASRLVLRRASTGRDSPNTTKFCGASCADDAELPRADFLQGVGCANTIPLQIRDSSARSSLCTHAVVRFHVNPVDAHLFVPKGKRNALYVGKQWNPPDAHSARLAVSARASAPRSQPSTGNMSASVRRTSNDACRTTTGCFHADERVEMGRLPGLAVPLARSHPRARRKPQTPAVHQAKLRRRALRTGRAPPPGR
jgi:hypothetical protein